MKTKNTSGTALVRKNTNGTVSPNENIFGTYMQEIGRIPLMSPEQEKETAKKAAQGDIAARERLVNSNLRFVITIAKKYQGKGLPLQDLISEGNLGLLNAVNSFEVEKGFRFITYAVWWIRQAITKAIHEKGRMIRIPCNKSLSLTVLENSVQTEKNGTDSPAGKKASYLNMSSKKAVDLINISKDVLSLDAPADYRDGKEVPVKDCLKDENCASPVDLTMNIVLRKELEAALSCLEEKEAEIIRRRFGLDNFFPMSLEEIGREYHICKERVRQIEERALDRLQHSPQCHSLRSFMV